MSSLRMRFGPSTIAVSADLPSQSVLAALTRWMPAEDIAATPDIEFRLRASALAESNRDATWWDGKAWSAQLHAEPTHLVWTLTPRETLLFRATRVVPDIAVRMAHIHHFGRREMRAGAALYGHLLPGAQLALLEREATLVHASSLVGPRGRGVLVLGRGGAGKTSASTSLYMRQPNRWRSMSDDLAIVSRDGLLYRSPVPINVFPYNTERFPELSQVVSRESSRADRAHWWLRSRLIGSDGVARRFAPLPEFLGPPTAQLAAIVDLKREDVATATVCTIDADVVIAEACRVLDHELARGFRPMRRLYAEGRRDLPFAHPDDQLAAVASTLASAFNSCQLTHISIPRQTPPDAVGRLVEAAVDGVA